MSMYIHQTTQIFSETSCPMTETVIYMTCVGQMWAEQHPNLFFFDSNLQWGEIARAYLVISPKNRPRSRELRE